MNYYTKLCKATSSEATNYQTSCGHGFKMVFWNFPQYDCETCYTLKSLLYVTYMYINNVLCNEHDWSGKMELSLSSVSILKVPSQWFAGCKMYTFVYSVCYMSIALTLKNYYKSVGSLVDKIHGFPCNNYY